MNGKYIRPTPHQRPNCTNPLCSPKTLYLFDGVDPIILGRASSEAAENRLNDADNGYAKVPSGRTTLGREHALLCLGPQRHRVFQPLSDDLIFHDSDELAPVFT
jgi:hypothetical protein